MNTHDTPTIFGPDPREVSAARLFAARNAGQRNPLELAAEEESIGLVAAPIFQPDVRYFALLLGQHRLLLPTQGLAGCSVGGQQGRIRHHFLRNCS